MITVPAYYMNWHLTASPSFLDLTSVPLAGRVDFQITGWDGNALPPSAIPNRESDATPIVFCQLPPPPSLLAIPGLRLVWIPMWDGVAHQSQEWWNALPKTLRIVAFSHAVANAALTAGLSVLELRYFKNPEDYPEAPWADGPVLFYWNRRGLYTPRFMTRFCRQLNAQSLLYRNKLDPGIHPGLAYELPARLGKTRVITLPAEMTLPGYLGYLRQANVFLAPRVREGVGMTILEAMASGCAVFANNAPTMCEYIESGTDGFLFKPPPHHWFRDQVLPALRRRMKQLGFVKGSVPRPTPQLEMRQLWRQVAGLDLRKMGAAARRKQALGYQNWLASVPRYAAFVTEWP